MERPSQPKEDVIQRFDSYYRKEDHVLGVEPSAGVSDALPFLRPGRILDLGAGDGRNTLFLAQQGFSVIAVDISPVAIANLTRYAARAKLGDRVKGIVADIDTFDIEAEGPFENVISTFTLHFLPKASFLPVLGRIMQTTTEGGINVIEDFTRDGPLYQPDRPGYYLKSEELRSLYEEQGWQVLYYQERVVTTKATDENGNPYQQGAAAIVAASPAAR